MKECNVVSSLTGLYMQYAYIVKVKNKPIFALCNNLADVQTEWNYFHNKFPHKNLSVHRITVIADVDTQIQIRS